MTKRAILLFICSLLPLFWMVYSVLNDGLGANPIEWFIRFNGDWALRFLLLTLAITPLRILLKNPGLTRYRRMLGLFTYFYAVLHVSGYIVLDQFFHWQAIWADLLKRPYITVGFGAFVLLTMLAVTSTKSWMLRLGRRWKLLHRLVYPAAILVIIHFFMMVKADIFSPGYHGAILTLLLSFRIWHKWRRHKQPIRQPA